MLQLASPRPPPQRPAPARRTILRGRSAWRLTGRPRCHGTPMHQRSATKPVPQGKIRSQSTCCALAPCSVSFIRPDQLRPGLERHGKSSCLRPKAASTHCRPKTGRASLEGPPKTCWTWMSTTSHRPPFAPSSQVGSRSLDLAHRPATSAPRASRSRSRPTQALSAKAEATSSDGLRSVHRPRRCWRP